jgi:hypothetical protein
LPRSAWRIAAVFALTFAAAPAFAATAAPQGRTTNLPAPSADRPAFQSHSAAAGIPDPRAPQRQPLRIRHRDAFARQDPGPSDIPAKDDWFDDQGLRLDAGGLAYKVRF